MKTYRIPASVRQSAAGLLLLALAAIAFSFTQPSANAEAASPDILALPPAAIPSAVASAVAAAPSDAGSIAASYIAAGRPDTRAVTPSIVASSIRALPQPAPPDQVADIVYRSVEELPEAAVDIVRAAATEAPHAAEEIVEAAVMALDDPWQEVTYYPGSYRRSASPDFKGMPDGKSIVDHKGAPGEPMTLAEAIVEAASEASGVDKGTLATAADRGIQKTPKGQIRRLSDPKVVSPVGDAGRTNFGNEPRRPTPTPTPTRRSDPGPVSD